MKAAAQGDERAFNHLVEKHHASVIRVATRLLGGDEVEAHDIAQQVFLRVWKAAARYEPTAKFTTWMFTIVRNQVFSEARRRQRRPTVPLSAPTHAEGDSAISDDHRAEWQDHSVTSPDDQLLKQELWRKIDQAIAALPEQQRLAVTLRRYEDLSYDDIAAVLQTSVSSVKSLLFRARGELRTALGEYLQ
jgi:RNA polymerase sigma-70 factor, ECF subfamily